MPDDDNGVVEFTDAVRSRRMVRNFDPERPISAEQLRLLLTLAVRAPSAGHTQGWYFLALADITSRNRYWSATSGSGDNRWLRGMRSAPVLVVCFADRDAYLDRYAAPDKGWSDRSLDRWPIPYWYVDTAMASMTLLLGATDAGLGACFFGVPGEAWSAVRDEFGVDRRLDPVGVIALGYPAAGKRSQPMGRARRPFDDVVTIIGATDVPKSG